MSLIYYSAVFLFICLAHQQQVRPNDVWTCFACSYFIYKKKIEHVSFLVFSTPELKAQVNLSFTCLQPVPLTMKFSHYLIKTIGPISTNLSTKQPTVSGEDSSLFK